MPRRSEMNGIPLKQLLKSASTRQKEKKRKGLIRSSLLSRNCSLVDVMSSYLFSNRWIANH